MKEKKLEIISLRYKCKILSLKKKFAFRLRMNLQ